MGDWGLVGTSFGWEVAPQCQTSRKMKKLIMFSESRYLTTASTSATRRFDAPAVAAVFI